MTEKRFKIVDEQFISYYGGTGHKISNGECGFWLWHDKTESQKVCDKLNSILDENERLKHENDKFVDVIAKKSQQAFLTRKENKQLKQQLQSILKLTRKIEDCTHDIKVIGDFE